MREATKTDLPQQNTSQTQCVLCWRMFSADGVCEKHKPYARSPEDEGKRGRVAERGSCTPPQELGMTPIERSDGVTVWGYVTEEENKARLERMQVARAARSKK